MGITNEDNNSLSENLVKVNNNILENLLKCKTNNWHKVQYSDNFDNPLTVRLLKGENKITFMSKIPNLPNIDFIQMSKNLKKSEISDVESKEYFNSIKEKINNRKNNAIWVESQLSTVSDTMSNSLLKSTVLPNPGGNYVHLMDVNFNYTYWTYLYLPQGSNITINTNSSTVTLLGSTPCR